MEVSAGRANANKRQATDLRAFDLGVKLTSPRKPPNYSRAENFFCPGSLVGKCGRHARPEFSAACSDNLLAGLNLDGDAKTTGSTEAPSPFLAKFNGHLIVLNKDSAKPADRALLNGVKYVAFYYSAKWCGPCRAFTPSLVEFYDSFKKSHPNFELIFVNEDPTEEDMMAYMTMDQMKWPAVRHDDIDMSTLQAKKYKGPGIPCLVLVDDQGKVLADSFVNGDYVGPASVIDAIKKLVPAPAPATASL